MPLPGNLQIGNFCFTTPDAYLVLKVIINEVVDIYPRLSKQKLD